MPLRYENEHLIVKSYLWPERFIENVDRRICHSCLIHYFKAYLVFMQFPFSWRRLFDENRLLMRIQRHKRLAYKWKAKMDYCLFWWIGTELSDNKYFLKKRESYIWPVVTFRFSLSKLPNIYFQFSVCFEKIIQ